MIREFQSVCPRDCFGSCRINTKVEDGKIINIIGDITDEYSKGALCAKGYAYPMHQNAPERLLYPLKQIGKGSGQWERISWDCALTEIAQRLIQIKEEEISLLSVCLDKFFGNIGILNNAVEGFFRSIGYITFMAGSPCDSAGIDAFMLNYGDCKKPYPSDMANAKLIIIWGSNPAWTAPHQMRYVFEARYRGAKLVVIDPYLTATAARADLYIQVKPGTDGFLALGIGKVLLEQDLLDYEFINNFTFGWEKFREHLEEIDLGEIALITGVAEQEIRELARLYGTSKPATIWLGIGAQHNLTGGQNYRAVDTLTAITGNIGVPGGNTHYNSRELGNITSIIERIKPPQDSMGLLEKNGDPTHRKINNGRFSELSEISPAIRFLWIAGHNPVAQDPNTSIVQEVLKSIETVIVVDSTLTASAHFADYVLPVTTLFEQEDIVISKWHNGIAYNEQALRPAGECKSDFTIMHDLANVMNKLKPCSSNFTIAENESEWLDFLMKEELYNKLGIEHYRELLLNHFTIDLPDVPWQDRKFLTPSGKYEFTAQGAAALGVASLPIPDLQLQPSAAYPLQMLSVRSFATLNSQFANLRELLEPVGNYILINPVTARAKRLEEDVKVCMYNQFGEIRMPVTFTVTVPPDLVVVYIASNSGTKNEINRLIALQTTDLGKFSTDSEGLAFKNCFVNLCKV